MILKLMCRHWSKCALIPLRDAKHTIEILKIAWMLHVPKNSMSEPGVYT